jgi:hypothetical protein
VSALVSVSDCLKLWLWQLASELQLAWLLPSLSRLQSQLQWQSV